MGIDCATLSPGLARWLHAAAAGRGVRFLDAPLAGARPQAEARALVFLAGGTESAFAAAKPLLTTLGAAAHHVGGRGAGSAVKLMVNALFATHVAAMAELIGFAERTGLDPERAIAGLVATPAASPAAKAAAASMLARSFAPAAPVDLVVKDMGLAVATAGAVGASLPVAGAAGAAYRAAAARGFGAENLTAIVKAYVPSVSAR